MLYLIVVTIRNQLFFEMQMYSSDEEVIFIMKSYDDNYYICNTRDKALWKNKMTYQVDSNTLSVEVLQKYFRS